MKREIIGIYNQPIESASNWKEIFQELKNRGLKKCDLLVCVNYPDIGGFGLVGLVPPNNLKMLDYWGT